MAAERFPLGLAICSEDGLVQQAYREGNGTLVNKVYAAYQPTYSMSQNLGHHLMALLDASFEIAGIRPGDSIAEIGSNDGAVLKQLASRGTKPIGWEPASNLASRAEADGCRVICDYFTPESARTYLEHNPPVRLLLTRHTLEHAFAPLEFLRAVRLLLAPDGVAVIEVPNLRLQMMNGHFEAMTFQHVSFFSVSSMTKALAAVDLMPIGITYVQADGGSMVIYARRLAQSPESEAIARAIELEDSLGMQHASGYQGFFDQVDRTIAAVSKYVSMQAARGELVVGYGAGGKGQSLLNMLRLRASEMPFVMDDTPGNAGRYIPGTGIQVVSSTDPQVEDARVVLLTAPTHISEILRKESKRRANRVQFLSTIPEFHQVFVD
jgi:hypothetical protein